MAQYFIDEDEWYPVFSIRKDGDGGAWSWGKAEFSDEELTDFDRVMNEFNAWQDKIREKMKQAKEVT